MEITNVRPGKPKKVPSDLIVNAVKKRKLDVFQANALNKIVSKKARIWKELSADLKHEIAPETIYNLILKPDFRSCVTGKNSIASSALETVNESNESDELSEEEPGSNDNGENFIIFDFFKDKKTFEELVEEKVYNVMNTRMNKRCPRRYTVFKSGLWQDWITKSLYKHRKISCGFQFYNERITRDRTYGYIQGNFFLYILFSC